MRDNRLAIILGGLLILAIIGIILIYNLDNFRYMGKDYNKEEIKVLEKRRKISAKKESRIKEGLKKFEIAYLNKSRFLAGMPFIEVSWKTNIDEAMEYDIFFGKKGNEMTKIGSNISKNSFLIERDLGVGIYNWKVNVKNTEGELILKGPNWTLEIYKN